MSITRQAVTRLTLDLGLPNCQTSAAIHKGDKNRRWEVTVIDEGKPFQLPDTWTVVLAGVKPDGTSLYNGCVVDDGKIVYDFASGPQIATCEGTFPVQFDVFDEEGELVATPKVWVNCYPNLREQVEDVDSTDEFSAISQFIQEANELRTRVDEAESKIKFTKVRVNAGQWQDADPQVAFMYIPAMTINTVSMILPINEETRKISREIGIEILELSEMGDVGTCIYMKRGKAAPTVDLDYIVVTMKAQEEIGVTASFVGLCPDDDE